MLKSYLLSLFSRISGAQAIFLKQCCKEPLILHIQAFNCCMLFVLFLVCMWVKMEKKKIVLLYLAASRLSCLLCYRFRQENPGWIFNALLLAHKATTQEHSGQWIILNQINMVMISLAGLLLHKLHRGPEYKMMSQQHDGLRSDSHAELLKTTQVFQCSIKNISCIFPSAIETKTHESEVTFITFMHRRFIFTALEPKCNSHSIY